MHLTLTAQCSNCTSWRTAPAGDRLTLSAGFCGRGLYPDEGKPLCAKYEVSPAFRNEIISTMLKEQGPMAMPVRLVSGRRSVKKMGNHRRR